MIDTAARIFVPSKFRRPGATNSEPSRDSTGLEYRRRQIITPCTFEPQPIPGASERFDRNSEPRQIRGRIHGPSGDLGPHKGKPTRKGKRVPSDEGKGPRYV